MGQPKHPLYWIYSGLILLLIPAIIMLMGLYEKSLSPESSLPTIPPIEVVLRGLAAFDSTASTLHLKEVYQATPEPRSGVLSAYRLLTDKEALAYKPIMVVASYTTYTDISHREIPNSATWTLLGLGMMGQMGLWVLGEVALVQIGLSVVLGFTVGYLLFMYGFWGAGDAKLYWAMVAAMPSTLFSQFSQKWPTFSFAFFSLDTPLWALLVNTILTNTVFLVVLLVIHRPQKPIETSASEPRKGMSWGWLRSGVEAAGVSGLVLGGTTLVGGTLTLAEAIVVGAVLYLIHEDLATAPNRIILVVPGLVIGVFSAISTGDYLIYLVLWAVLWGIRTVYVYIHSLEYQKFVQPVSIDALQPGMVLHQSIYEASEEGRVEVIPFGEQSRDAQELIGRKGKPLTIRKVRQLKDLQRKGLFIEWDDQLEVELSLPFAPALMVGVSLTLIWAGSIVRPANKWIQPLFDAF